ncbi:MAG: pyridoxine 5'-phosphate synthase [Planctomycetes bacterium]|nr:pyridoxine 5'-phosphate synthase [Planctomycetota bacterium]
MTAFSANLNKIAMLRNTRDNGIPDVGRLGRICLGAGAAGLTVHPRPDQRHTRPADVHGLRALTSEQGAEFNVEGYPTDDFIALVCAARPEQCTLVPDWPGQRTSDHGWDAASHVELLKRISARLKSNGIRVSVFLDPEPAQIPHVAAVGADRIELYTEPYARAFAAGATDAVLERYRATAGAAQAAGLGVNAGHDLSLANLGAFLTAVPGILEVSIGHALVAEALEFGMAETVRRYRAICDR